MKHKLSIAATFKDETRYLKEWVEYHLMVGVDHIYLLCHDNVAEASKAETVLQPYEDAGLLDLLLLIDETPGWQMNAWTKILRRWGDETEWMCLTDADAFLYPVNDYTVPKILAEYDMSDVAGLAVFVSTFGSSGLKTPPELQVESFLRRAPLNAPCNWTANYILRPDRCENPTPELGYAMPIDGFRIIDTDGVEFTKGKRRGPMDVLRLNHYSVRSAEDWARKVKRGWPEARANWTDKKRTIAEHKLAMLDRNDEYDGGMLRFVPELKRRMSLGT